MIPCLRGRGACQALDEDFLIWLDASGAYLDPHNRRRGRLVAGALCAFCVRALRGGNEVIATQPVLPYSKDHQMDADFARRIGRVAQRLDLEDQHDLADWIRKRLYHTTVTPRLSAGTATRLAHMIAIAEHAGYADVAAWMRRKAKESA